MTGPPVVKVCCISSLEEAQAAIAAGADGIGLVSAMPSGPGVIPEELIAQITAAVRGRVETFLLTSRVRAVDIVQQHRRCGTTTLQLVDHVPPSDLRQLRSALPGIRLVQVIHVRGEPSLEEAQAVEGLVDALLLDSGNPTLAVRELGGTGRTHDWDTSARIRASVAVPVYLAGGLHAGNVAAAVAAVRPFGLDLCSGVRREGRLDAPRLRAFFDAVHGIAT